MSIPDDFRSVASDVHTEFMRFVEYARAQTLSRSDSLHLIELMAIYGGVLAGIAEGTVTHGAPTEEIKEAHLNLISKLVADGKEIGDQSAIAGLQLVQNGKSGQLLKKIKVEA